MTPIPAGWKPIESAPKTGRTLLLGYWNSHGKWRTVRGQWMSAEYIGQEWDEPDGVEAGWFETAVEADDVPNCWPVSPSYWQPMPEPPCPTCNDQGAVGNILNAELCPDCSPASVAPGDAQDERQAFEAWAKERGYQSDELARCKLGIVSPEYFNLNTENAWKAWQARASVSAPAAGDALDSGAVAALRLALKYWEDRQQRYKNRSPVWVTAARAALAAQVPQQGEA